MCNLTTKVTASWLIQLSEAAESRHIDIHDLFSKHDQNLANIAVFGNFIEMEVLDKMLLEVIERVDDFTFALDFAKNIKPSSFHGLGYMMFSADSIYESLNYLCKYQRILSTSCYLKVIETEKNVCLLFEPSFRGRQQHKVSLAAQIAFIGSIIQLLRMISNHKFSPLSIKINADSQSKPLDFFTVFADCKVSYQQSETMIVFDKFDCKRSLYSINPSLVHAHQVILERELSLLDKNAVVNRVVEQIHQMLPMGEVNQSEVADNLNMSLRHLQRKLQHNGTNYKLLLEKTRKKLAIKYIYESDLSLGEISYLLGFSTHGNFNRAFKRWTNKSPGIYRKELTSNFILS